MKIIADTATLIPPCEGKERGLAIIPVCVSIDDRTYQDYTEITTAEFLEKIKAGGVPSSSQPAIGDILDVMESSDEEMLFLTVGDGLSGAYQTILGARNMASDPERIHVMDSQSLAGPMRYIALKAVALKEQGLPMEEIKAQLQTSIDSSVSFVVPEDFDFLKRSGRLTAFTAKVGAALKLLPVLTQTKDRKRITPIGIKRSWKSAVEAIIQQLQKLGVGEDHLISICHPCVPERAEQVLNQIREQFPFSDLEVLELSPGLSTHGGPGCIVIQAVLK